MTRRYTNPRLPLPYFTSHMHPAYVVLDYGTFFFIFTSNILWSWYFLQLQELP